MEKIEQEFHSVPLKVENLFTKQSKRKYLKNYAFKTICFVSALLLGIVLLAITIFVGKTGLLVFKDVPVTEFFFSKTWEPYEDKFGAAIFIIGTLSLTGLTMLFSVPISLAFAIFIAEIAPGWMQKIVRSMLDLLVGIPSIIYGYLGLTILVPFLRDVTGSLMGDGLLAASLVLTLMVLPTITRISDDAISAVSEDLKEGSYALGATRFQTVFRIILPAAKTGILTASILGMARAIGETMAVVMVIGNTPQLPTNLVTPTAVLTSNIVMQIIDVPFGSTWNNALYMMAFLLLLISTFIILIIRSIRSKGV
jgi:phosphate transport system permease protein